MPKQTQNQKTGAQAEAFVNKAVRDMGFIWRSKESDFGIDGEIEVVDRNEQVTGAVALVQVKGTMDRFPGEGPDSFTMTFRRDHVDYWMRSQRPVLVICVSIRRQQAWWKRLDLWFADGRTRSKRAVKFDKATDLLTSDTAALLAAAATPETEPVALLNGHERLTTNLLKVRSFASTVYSSPTKCSVRAEAWDRMREAGSLDCGFHIIGGRVLSLLPLSVGPLAVLADGPITESSTGEWAETDDADKRRTFVSLLNYSIRSIYHPDLVFHNDKKFVYVPAGDNLRPRKVKGRAVGSRGRTFFSPHKSRDDINRVSYYKHYAAVLRFQRWADIWYLEIVPTYHYTIDGRRESLYASEYLAGIKRLERNKAVIDLVRAWADFLKRTDQPSLFAGADNRIVFDELETVEVDAAIDEKVWVVDYAPEEEGLDHGLFVGEIG